MVPDSVLIANIKRKSAYWHVNIALLVDAHLKKKSFYISGMCFKPAKKLLYLQDSVRVKEEIVPTVDFQRHHQLYERPGDVNRGTAEFCCVHMKIKFILRNLKSKQLYLKTYSA